MAPPPAPGRQLTGRSLQPTPPGPVGMSVRFCGIAASSPQHKAPDAARPTLSDRDKPMKGFMLRFVGAGIGLARSLLLAGPPDQLGSLATKPNPHVAGRKPMTARFPRNLALIPGVASVG